MANFSMSILSEILKFTNDLSSPSFFAKNLKLSGQILLHSLKNLQR